MFEEVTGKKKSGIGIKTLTARRHGFFFWPLYKAQLLFCHFSETALPPIFSLSLFFFFFLYTLDTCYGFFVRFCRLVALLVAHVPFFSPLERVLRRT
ncbi:hypothetical protein BC940DRAFT_6028 [Gongronella butleri]|nr:hypothetical protein BC940DRAFT_6028 [Gongronella butleri]